MKFIQPEILYCASDPIGQDDGLAEELSKSSFILGKDCGGVGFHGWHGASYHSVGMIMPRKAKILPEGTSGLLHVAYPVLTCLKRSKPGIR